MPTSGIQNSIDQTQQLVQQPSADSMRIIRDSLEALYKTDSISFAKADSIKQMVLQPSGFQGKPLPETMQSEMLIPILMLGMFFSYVYVLTRGRKMILETIKDFFYLKERSSIFIESGANQVRISMHLLFILISSIGLLMHFYLFDQKLVFEFQEKIMNLGLFWFIALAIIGIKYGFIRLLGYIFLDKNIIGIFNRAYFSVLFALGLALYPLLLGLVYAPDALHTVFSVLIILLTLITFVLIFYKTIQIFLDKISSLFYILLYLCTLEILPIFIVIKALT